MEKSEFSTIRKNLGKTQKEMSDLLGVSLKAISSYEQGWRNIPVHVERQILFLLARKYANGERNCWDIMDCPPEKKHQCPAWEFKSGTLCWFINGTTCGKGTTKNWNEKIALCRKCPVLKNQLSP
jgi:DNA-binding XRE family transcriptional regulator